jgi:hypothetical protein
VHGGYLALALAFLRNRDAVAVKGDTLWKVLRWYALLAMCVS